MSNYIGSSDEALDFLRSIAVRDRLIFELTDALRAILSDATEDIAGLPRDEALDRLGCIAEIAQKAVNKVQGEQA